MKWLCFVVTIFIFVNTVNAQTEWVFSGYVIDLPIYQRNNDTFADFPQVDKNQFFNLTRTRLRPTLYIGENSRINLEYEFQAVYFSTPLNLFSPSGNKTSRQIVDLTWLGKSGNNFFINHFVDRLYLRQSFDWGNITIGRQRISWGTGRIWNPTDLFNPINPANFSKTEKDGADAVAVKYSLGNFTDLEVVYNPQEIFKQSNYGFRFRTNFEEYDVSIISGRFDEKYIIGLDFAGNLFDAGVRGEGIVSINEDNSNDNFVKYILGFDYQFTPKLYAVFEFQFNGEGKPDKTDYELLRLAKGEIINLSKNYLYGGINYQIHPLVMLTFGNNSNLNDGSGFINFLCNYSYSEDIYLNLGTQLFYGNSLSEYWYYPKSIYLQGEFYF